MQKMIFAILLGLFFTGTNVYAAERIYGGPIYGGPSQASIVCYVLNRGDLVVITDHSIVDQSGNKQPATVDTCEAGLLPPLVTCAFSAPVANNMAYSCYAQTGNSQDYIPDITGTVDVRDANGFVLLNAELR